MQVGDVEIHWLGPGLSIRGIALETASLALTVEDLDVRIPWRRLVQSDTKPDFTVVRPVVVLTQADDAEEGERPSLQLDTFESLTVVDGTMRLRMRTHSGPTELELAGVAVVMDNPRLGSSQMGTRVKLSARLPERGSIMLDGQVSSADPRAAWRFRFAVARLALATFNNLWRDIVEMDVETGTLSARGELQRTERYLRGRVTPNFEDLVLLDPDEDALHPMGEALFGHMLSAANSTVEVNQALEVGSTMSFDKLLTADWKRLIAAVIKRGYSRRLDTLDGYEAKIGDVEVDFGMGLLTLLDVQLIRESRRLDEPFVVVPRIDVVFDESVMQHGATSYKHVTLWDPIVRFVSGRSGEESQIQFDERWVDKISALPFKTRTLIVHGGRVQYRDERREEPVEIFVSEIEMAGLQMAAGQHPAGYRGARLSGSGKIMGEATATIAVAFEPRAQPANIDLDLFVPPLELSVLNPVLRTYAEVEAESGSLGFSAHMTARARQVDASVVPTVVKPKLKGVPWARKKLRHVVLERRIKKLRGRAIDLSFEVAPGEGVLHEFFPEFLIAALRER